MLYVHFPSRIIFPLRSPRFGPPLSGAQLARPSAASARLCSFGTTVRPMLAPLLPKLRFPCVWGVSASGLHSPALLCFPGA